MTQEQIDALNDKICRAERLLKAATLTDDLMAVIRTSGIIGVTMDWCMADKIISVRFHNDPLVVNKFKEMVGPSLIQFCQWVKQQADDYKLPCVE